MSLTYDDLDALAADLRAAREEVERLRGELAEAQATLANERGEGEPPEPGWRFKPGRDSIEDDRWVNARRRLAVWRVGLRWVYGRKRSGGGYEGPGGQESMTARAAMRAAIAALPSPPETP